MSRRSCRRASSACAAASSTSSRWARRCRTASTSSTTRSRSIKTFDVDTQRTIYKVSDVRLLPAREFPLDDAGRTRFRSRFREVFEGDPSKSALYKDVSNGIVPAGIEYYLPLFFEATALLGDYLPRRAPSLRCMAMSAAPSSGSGRTPNRAIGCCAATRRGRCCRRPSCSSRPTRSTARQDFRARRACPDDRRRGARARLPSPTATATRRCRPCNGSPRRRPAVGAQTLRRGLAAQGRDRGGERGTPRDDAAVLRGIRLPPASRRRVRRRARSAERVLLVAAPVAAGFGGRKARSRSSPRASSMRASCAVPRAKPAKRSNVDAMVRDLSEVRIGDPVVHEEHGIGRYLGLLTLDLGDGSNEFLQLVYANDAKLYVPGQQPAPHQPLQRRLAGCGAAARARQRPVGEGEEASRAAGARHGRRAPEPLRPARRPPRSRVRSQAPRLRSIRRRLRIRGDAGPVRSDRGGDQGHDVRQADGSTRLRRRRFRQDRGRAARRVRRPRGRQAGGSAGAHDPSRRAALPDVHRPLRRLSGARSRSFRASARRRRRRSRSKASRAARSTSSSARTS